MFGASIGFATAWPDRQIVSFLRTYGVLPYAVYFALPGAQGIHAVPMDRARPGLIADMRAALARRGRTAACGLATEYRALDRAMGVVRSTADKRDAAARRRLSAIRQAQTVSSRLASGEAAVYGLEVTGSHEQLGRLRSDPLVRVFNYPETGPTPTSRGYHVPGIGMPEELRDKVLAIAPDVAAMSAAEVHAELSRILDETPEECRGSLGRALIEEPVVPLTAGTDGAYHASGLKFEAYSRLTNRRDVIPGTQTPRELQVTVVVTNPTTSAVSFGVLGCTALIRVHHPQASGLTPVWDSRRGITCAQEPMRVDLHPGESRSFEEQVDIYHVLGDSLSSGRYQPAILFRHEDATYEVPAGEVDLPSNLDDVAYSAAIRIEGGQLRASGVVMNRRDTPIRISYGACGLRVRAYAGERRTSEPVWHSEAREPWGGHVMYGCPGYLTERQLAPRETLAAGEFSMRAPLIEVLGDSLPDGRYWFGATIRVNSEWLPEVAAGSADLVLPREPLPASRTARSITYAAHSEVGRDSAGRQVVRGILTAERTGPQRRARPGMPPPPPSGSLVRLSADCPVVLHAYRDRVRRDNAPRSGEPDWKSRESCGHELEKRAFYNGQPQRFEVEMPVSSILGARLPSGRYHFAVVVQAEGKQIFLSAGAADLRR